jgi:hypothetical protein
MKKYLLILLPIALSVLTACKQDVASAVPFTYNKPGQSPIAPTIGTAMTLISPTSSPSYIGTPTVQIDGLVIGETVGVYINSNCSTLVGQMVATSSSVTLTTNTLPVGTYSFYTRSINRYAASACSGAFFSYTYLGVAPTNATSMTLVSPTSSPSTVSTPTFLLSGVVAGETSSIYIDSSCTDSYGSAVASGTTVNVTSNAIAPSTVQYYTKATNTAGSTTCSVARLSYTYSGVAPTSASALTLTDPTSSPNYDSTPTFLAAGVANGDTVKIYTDSGCSSMVGSSVVGNATTVLVTSSALSVGTYSFYTKSTNSIGTSACSAVRATYQYLGAAPTVQVSWTANREKSVNSTGGGYRVYYGSTSPVNTSTGTYVDVPFVSGTAPVTKNFTNLPLGTTYFKVVGYGTLASVVYFSAASSEFSISLP